MFQALLILIFFFLFLFLLRRGNRKGPGALSLKELSIAYGLKVILGLLYGYIFITWFGGDDTWYFHNGSIEEYQKLINDPWQFIADLNPIPAFQRNESFSRGWYFYLSDLEFWMLSKPMAIFNFISGGNYYVNVVFFNFIVCWGHIWLFRLYVSEFPQKRKALFIAIFLIPGIVFWLSGIRGDGLIVFFLGLLLIQFHKWLNRRSKISLLYILLALAGITILRSVLLLLLIPVLLSWFISVRFRARLIMTSLIVYGATLILFFGSLWISPQKNLPGFVANRQAEYFRLRGNTRFDLDTLQPNFKSYISILPQSINNSFFRPYLWEAKGFFQIGAALQTILLLLIFILFLWKKESNWKQWIQNPLIFLPGAFAVTLFIFIGYTIPFPGAIIRYKMPAELLLFIALILLIDWKKLYRLK